MSSILGVVVCLSPLLIFATGYYIGRFGSPLVLQVRGRRDRRAPARELESTEESAAVVYGPDFAD